MGYGTCSLALDKVQRRVLLRLLGVNSIFANTVFAAPIQDMKEPEVLSIQDDEACQWSEDTRSNGYFVHSTVDQFSGESSPVILTLNGEQIIRGLQEVLVGMKVGGKRRALIPPSLGYISDTLQPIPEEFGPRCSLLSHTKEPLIFEVQLLKVL